MEIVNRLEDLSTEELRARLDGASLPAHVAVIMDGNGRWAKQRRFARIRGHRAGIKAVREAVTACREVGVRYLTLYAFSLENWARPAAEVRALMNLLRDYLVGEREELVAKEIRLKAVGRLAALPEDVRAELDRTMALTEGFGKLTLTLALSYSGRAEIADAVAAAAAAGAVPPDEETIGKFLYAPEHPDPDLLIRTSGELRVSNFLLWQIAYSEIYITPTFWPDFRRKHLLEAILEYQRRDRRYGGI